MRLLLIALAAVNALWAQGDAVKLTVAAVQMRSSFHVADNRARIIATLDPSSTAPPRK